MHWEKQILLYFSNKLIKFAQTLKVFMQDMLNWQTNGGSMILAIISHFQFSQIVWSFLVYITVE